MSTKADSDQDDYDIELTIEGEGPIDEDYNETVNLMGEIAREKEGERERGYMMSHYLTPEVIEEARHAKTEKIEQANAKELIKLAKAGTLPFFKPEDEAHKRLKEVDKAMDARPGHH